MNKRKLKFMATVGLVLIFLISSVMTIATAAQEASRVTAVLSTDKESYVNGDTAALQLTVTNGYNYKLDDMTAEISLPNEMTVQDGTITGNAFSLEAGESKTNRVMLSIQEKSDEPSTSSNPDESVNSDNQGAASSGKAPKTGDCGWRLWAMLTALSGVAVLAVFRKGKHRKKLMSLFLSLAILLTSLPVSVSADDLFTPSGSLTVEKKVTINGNARTIKATVTYNEKEESEKSTVTITFKTFEGTPVDAITIKKGEAPGRLPQSFKTGMSFMGWYSDEELTKPFYDDTVLTEDLTLYASFVEVDDEVKIANHQTYYEENCDANMPITLICDEEITAENLDLYMTLYAFTGEAPESFTVTKSGDNEYTIVPKTPYSAGCQYRMTVPEGVKFKELEDTVNEYTFRIYKEQSEVVELTDGIKYVDRSAFAETDTPYKYKVSKSYAQEKHLALDDTICIGDGTQNYSEDMLFINIVKLEDYGDFYYVSGEDSNVGDVFENVDVNFKKSAENEFLKEDFDPETLATQVYNSAGADQLNMVLAAMLAESPDVKEEMGGISLFDADESMLDFSDYASLDKSKAFSKFQAKLKNMMTITVTVGSAKNDNFYDANDDYWSVLTFQFKWKGTIKNKLKIDATFTISEYMNVTLQGYNSTEFKWFDLPQLEFDYAANMYSQTDIEIKILICSVDSKDGYKDISDKLTSLFSSNKENDTEGLIGEVQEMLDKKGDYIELCEIPFFTNQTPLAVFSLNMELAFVVKVNFAAGLSSKLSVLDATQVGARGNSADGTFDMYKNKLIGSDRYSFDLAVCGYLGVKMGVRGSLTVSFLGLKRLGEVGVSVEIGAYLDMYGYAQYHIVRPDDRFKKVYSTLIGGFYMEAGIYLEVKLIAKSDIFKVKAEVSLVDEKWPLFTMGKKDLVISLNDLETPIMIDSKGSMEGSLNLSDAPALTARTLDLTTGKINENTVIPWDSVTLRFSNKCFGDRITYKKQWSHDRDSSAESMVDMYYEGQTLQFTKKASNTASTAAKAKVIWYDSTRVKEEDIGKIYKTKFYLDVDGERTLLGERDVISGNYAGYCSYPEMNSPIYVDGKWDKDPYSTVINGDTEFVYSVKRAQARAVFVYFDNLKKQWTAEMKVITGGEVPAIDSKYENEHMKISSWEMISGKGLNYSNTVSLDENNQQTSYGICNGLSEGWSNYTSDASLPELMDYINEDALLTGQSTNEILCSVTGNSAEDARRNMQEQYSKECSMVAFYYTPLYLCDRMNVSYTNLDSNGNLITKSTKVLYGDSFNYPSVLSPYWMNFMGYSPDGGKTVYYNKTDFPAIYEDTAYEGIYTPIMHNVTLQYYDATTNEYKDYKTYSIRRGLSLPQEYFDEAEAAYIWGDAEPQNIYGWKIVDSDSPATNPIFKDSVMRIEFRRNVRISLDAGDGELLFENYVQSFDTDNYQLKIGERAAKKSDNYYDYTLTGWKNLKTGEIYGVNDVVTIYNPVTLVAVYTPVPKAYNIKITTTYGTLKNGEKEINLDVDYDTYNRLISEYSNWKPANYRDDANHCTYICNAPQIISEKKSYTINYISWKKVVDKHKITIDVNGGLYDGSTEIEQEWNTTLDLSQIVATKEDDSVIWKMRDWTDKAGTVYAIDGKYLVTADDTLTLNWEVGSYKEYTITFELDGQKIDEKTYHKNDTLSTFGKPAEADGKVFNGWIWYNSKGKEITPYTQMPAENLTLKGTTTTVYIKYVVDGQEVTAYKTAGKIGQQQTVRGIYEEEGYTATNWTTTDVAVDEAGNFVMPEHDVTFTATTSKNSYKVTYYHKGAFYGEEVVPYGDYVLLKNVPKESGSYYAWTSEDVSMTDVGFYMPAHDVVINSKASETAKHIIYYVNNEIISSDTAIPGQTVTVKNKPEDANYAGKNFSGWYVENRALQENATFEMGEEDIHIYGYFTTGTTKVNIYFDENNESPDLVMYGNAGEIINITMKMNNQALAGYKVNGEVVNEIVIPSSATEINAYVEYKNKTYKVMYRYDKFKYNLSTLPADTEYRANERVDLCALPADTRSHLFTGWFSTEVEIQKDENGTFYFIMPERDVTINIKAKSTTQRAENAQTASVYINSPYSDTPVFFNDYDINSENINVYFDVPYIEGYEFICWRDESGNPISNQCITLNDMNGADRKFYGEYRKLELHIIEFRINNEVVKYQPFYDAYEVSVTTPTVTLGDGEAISEWSNYYFNGKTTISGNTMKFYTGDKDTYEYARMDFVFDSYIYKEENSYPVYVIYKDGTSNYDKEFKTNENAELKFNAYPNGKEVTYKLYYELNSGDEILVEDAVRRENDEYIITVPHITNVNTWRFVIRAENVNNN